MMKKFVAALALSFCATGVSAETLHCEQTYLSSNGFVSISAAQSWFPEKFAIKISGEEAISDFYGKGTVELSSGRKKISFVTASSANVRKVMKITFIEKSSVYVAQLTSIGRFAQIPGAKGKCSIS